MPRHSRVAIPDFPHHLIQRGHDREPVFHEEPDFRAYLDTLAEFRRALSLRVYAYCLMTNHVHLLLTPTEPDSASLLMKHVGQRYTQYINRHRRRIGTLWEGRFRSSIVDTKAYLLTCYRYRTESCSCGDGAASGVVFVVKLQGECAWRAIHARSSACRRGSRSRAAA